MKRFLALILAALLLCAPALAWETESPEAAEELYAMPKPRRVVIDEVPGRLFADIPYCGENSRDTEILHIVLPEEGEGPFPVIVSVHGGAWRSGNTSKKHEVSATQYAAFAGLKRGYAVVCVDYSVKNTSNPVAFPLQIQEIHHDITVLPVHFHIRPGLIPAVGDFPQHQHGLAFSQFPDPVAAGIRLPAQPYLILIGHSVPVNGFPVLAVYLILKQPVLLCQLFHLRAQVFRVCFQQRNLLILRGYLCLKSVNLCADSNC